MILEKPSCNYALPLVRELDVGLRTNFFFAVVSDDEKQVWIFNGLLLATKTGGELSLVAQKNASFRSGEVLGPEQKGRSSCAEESSVLPTTF
jgi:hypothetical protein